MKSKLQQIAEQQACHNSIAKSGIGDIDDGLHAVCAFKYYAQFNMMSIEYPIPYCHVTGMSLYRSSKQTFDKLVQVFKKHQIDVGSYIKYAVEARHLQFKDYCQLLDRRLIEEYAYILQVKEQRKHVYQCLVASAKFIASYCVQRKLMTAIDGIKDMIREKKLAPYYVTGKISKHYLAMIHSFSALVEKLDPISKGELMPISHRAEKLNDDAIEAMVQEHGSVFKLSNLTDEYIDMLYGEQQHML